ncbi:MAG TPA: aminotransferase class V-fold PLP-dependent enzyme [Ktedonobacterales bacterium]|jgi:selenocysteine lyase/cysteine desulfurase|nr:aminotransferase class V-fold PLP-dependent enzyme [Ktedonobacterales bacterium]
MSTSRDVAAQPQAITPDEPEQALSLDEAEATFLRNAPEFAATRHLDELRATEYGRLDRADHVYLDYTGGGLYAESQVRAHADMLLDNVFGNPHSSNPTSLAMTRRVEQARAFVLSYFNASPDEYVAIFTLNASGALKLVGESYPFGPGGQYLLIFDNHNSVNGIREFARTRGAQVTYAPVLPPDLRIDADKLSSYLQEAPTRGHRLFAFPAQSNFSGVQHSLDWIELAHANGWDVLLDAAAFVPTNRLDLSRWHPDFVSLSFYKMFGYPTGVGCLLVRREALAKLHRPWFAGGTITVASVQGGRHYLHEGSEAFEDGTINYLTLPAVEIGLRHIEGISVEAIHTRVHCLTEWLLRELLLLRHSDGSALVRLYGPTTGDMRGGTITFNLGDRDRHFIDHRLVEHWANQANISLRTGCFCNPGGGELALGISAEEISSCFVRYEDRLTLDEFRRCIDDKSTGAVRISVGLATNFADVYRFVEFARSFIDKSVADLTVSSV